jgi:glycosyltransferase involved in cell wall biosynthesis
LTFTGWEQHLAPIYADMDVKVISSVNEGTPLTVIEALSTGCPVVATAVGGIPDLLEGGTLGKIVPSGDAQALADGILDLLQSPPNMQPIQAAMIERYGLDRSVHDLDLLYRGLLAHKR